MAKAKRVPVTIRAMVQRINRKLKDDDRLLRKYRGGQWASDLGEWYVVDIKRNAIVEGHVDPEELGRKLGVLHPWEEVAE